ncbi:MAG: ankyrin repeat domain-containing protein, partial [Planctomycetes bacterium]|nr:ankyrin repeat domain-containing protein [Planctomycetota bacterium]
MKVAANICWRALLSGIVFILLTSCKISSNKAGAGSVHVHAATSSKTSCLRIFLKDSGQPDVRDEKGRTPLHYAAWTGDIQSLNLLLGKGAHVSVIDERGVTPLHLAAGRGNLRVVEALLEKGADPTKEDMDGDTPVNWASERGHVEVLQELLQNGGRVNVPQGLPQPLQRAAAAGHLGIVRMLVEAGAQVNRRESSALPLHCAIREGHPAIVQYLLLQGANLHAKTDSGRTPMWMAIFCRDRVSGRILEQNGAPIDNPFAGVLVGNLRIVRRFLKQSSNAMDSTFGPSAVPLWYFAAEVGNRRALKLFLDEGFDPNTRWKGETALHAASKNGHIPVMQLLLDYGADVNASYTSLGIEKTPLKLAIWRSGIDSVVFLLWRGAKFPEDGSARREIVLYGLRAGAREEVILFLLSKEAEYYEPHGQRIYGEEMCYSAARGYIGVLQWFFALGNTVNVKG